MIAGLGFIGIWRCHYFFVAIGLCLCMVSLSVLVALELRPDVEERARDPGS